MIVVLFPRCLFGEANMAVEDGIFASLLSIKLFIDDFELLLVLVSRLPLFLNIYSHKTIFLISFYYFLKLFLLKI